MPDSSHASSRDGRASLFGEGSCCGTQYQLRAARWSGTDSVRSRFLTGPLKDIDPELDTCLADHGTPTWSALLAEPGVGLRINTSPAPRLPVDTIGIGNTEVSETPVCHLTR